MKTFCWVHYSIRDPTTEVNHKSGSTEYWQEFLDGFGEKVILT